MLAQTAAVRSSAPAFIDCGMIDDRSPSRNDGDLAAIFPFQGVRMSYGRGEEIFGEGERADCVYKVL